MEKISMLIGKPVISIFDGKILGTVEDALLDKKFSKVEWFRFFDDEGQKEYLVRSKNVFAVNDAIMLKNAECVLLAETAFDIGNNPINFSIWSVDGKLQSKILDIQIGDNFGVIAFETKDGEKLTKKEFLTIGNNVAILRGNCKTKIANFKAKPKIPTIKQEQNMKVEMLENQGMASQPAVPKKVLMQNYNFLIGRKLDKNIYADNRQLIAKKHTIITAQIIYLASKNGKLKELTNSSLT